MITMDLSTILKGTITIDSYELDRDNYILMEPHAVYGLRDFVIKNHTRYGTIYTYDSEVLKCPNAKKYLFGDTRILKSDYENIDISKKKFQVSSLTGFKTQTIGHRLRQDVYNSQHLFPSNYVFFVSNDNWLNDKRNNPSLGVKNEAKIDLFREYQFAIVIENSQQENYFTEKLIDCLITKTIPIYWGCPNISEYFNTNGWIFPDSVESFYKNPLTEDYYSKYTDVIEENYQKAISYSNVLRNIQNAI